MFSNILSLAFQGMLRKKRSSILIFLVLLTSFSFTIVSLSLVGSISKTNAEFRLNTYGEWYFAIPSGMDDDVEWLQNREWPEKIGTAGNFGTISAPSGQIAFGTLDSALINIGRITLDQGSFPTADYEIAMEADALSALGYDYTIGQEITLCIEVPCAETSILVEQSYILCGIIHEYSNLWVLNKNSNNRLLVSAVVTEAAANQVVESARERVTTTADKESIRVIPQYFIAVEEENRETACTSLNGWLDSTRSGNFGDKQVSENNAAYPESESKEYDNFYVYMIAVVMMIAVLCVYIMQLPNEIHSFAVLRSIGITKHQMALLLMEETSILIFPAVLLGIPCGAGLTWLALRGLMYSGSVAIQVTIPYETLFTVILLWVAAVLLSRFIMFTVTVHTPLTGRMQLQNSKSRQVKLLRSGLIVLLLGVFGAVTIFTGMESIKPEFLQEYWGICPSYVIWKDTDNTVSLTETDLIEHVPGVLCTDGFGEMEIGLSFPGMDEQTVTIYAIDENDWDETFDFGEDQEDFHNGNIVLICIPELSDEDYLLPEDELTLRVYNSSKECIAKSVVDVCVKQIPGNAMNRGLAALWEPYTVICSEGYLKQLLTSMDVGEKWDKYTAGSKFGYDRVYVTSDLNSTYLSTDIAIAELCSENELFISNRRQEYQARVQENLQTLILLYSSGCCIAVVALLILGSTLSLEAEQEKHYFGVLWVIGMSSRQMRRRIFGKAFLRSLIAVTAGWVLYGGYSIVEKIMDGSDFTEAVSSVISYLEYHGCDIQRILLISVICLVIPFVVSLAAKRKIKKGELKL